MFLGYSIRTMYMAEYKLVQLRDDTVDITKEINNETH